MPPPVPANLHRLALFEGSSREALTRLEVAAVERRFRAGEIVYQEGDACDGLYVVAAGLVVVRRLRTGEPVERVCDAGPGDVFGELEVIDGKRRAFEARAEAPSDLFRLPPAELWSFLRHVPAVETRIRTLVIYRRTGRMRALLTSSQRRSERIRVDRPVWLRRDQGAPTAVRVEDLSYGGACISGAPATLLPGEIFLLQLSTPERHELLRTEARVGWRMRDVVGLMFEGETEDLAHRRRIDLVIRELLGDGADP
jgi:CRP-like cAMP-binding protein